MFFRFLSRALIVVLGLACVGAAGFIYWKMRPAKENPYDPIIVQVAREEGVDPFLVRALIWRESKFNPLTLGTAAQEHGLMQVTPMVGQEWAKAHKIENFKDDDLYDPTTNIRAGTWYLSHALRHWSQTDDPVSFGLAEYNAGRTNALKWVDPSDPSNHIAFMERISFPSTRKYVEIILEKRGEYRVLLANNRWYRDYAMASAITAAP